MTDIKTRTFAGKAKDLYNSHKVQINLVGFILLFVVLPFIIGFTLSAKFATAPLSDSDYAYMEQIARNVYEQGNDNIIYEMTEGINIEIDATTITVSKDGHVGKVTAKLQNGELLTERVHNYEDGIARNILTGIIYSIILAATIVVVALAEV